MSNSNSPWLANESWKNGQIASREAGSWKVLAVFALMWNVFTTTITGFVLLDHRPDFPDPVYFVLLFPAVGLLLAWLAFQQYRQWRRYGPLKLTLDPYPGNIGGDVGGYLTLSAHPAELADLEASVSCVRVTIRRSNGKSSRTESVRWRSRADTHVDRTANGSRISFRAEVEPGLQGSEPDDEDKYIKWLLHLKSTQAGLERSFEIPVFDTGFVTQSHLRVDAAPQMVGQHQFPARTVRVQRRPDGLELIYPSSRTGNGLWIGILFGCVFFGAGLWLGYQTVTGFSRQMLFASAVTGFLCLFFSSIGLAVMLGSLYLKFNELRILIARDTVTTRRSFGPWRWIYSSPVNKVRKVGKSISMQSSQGTNSSIYYSITGHTDGRAMAFGDGIKGQPLADALLQLIADEFGEGVMDSEQSVDDFKQRRRQMRQRLDPKRVAQVKSFAKAMKWVGRLIVLTFIVLFVIQFMGY